MELFTSWVARAWIMCAFVTFYAQVVFSKSSVMCDEKHYWKNSRCCKKCEPGFHVFSHCTESHQTICVKCSSGEYQPGWTDKARCLQQKYCDPIKGFMERPENPVAEEPCRCFPGLQCSPINCEYCERIPTCAAGHGLEPDSESVHGRKKCVACKKGFFSVGNKAEPCKQWTRCKTEGRSETQTGSAEADAVCGQSVSDAAPSWVIVSVLSAITVVCLLILLLFCNKDKLKLLSVNLRSCVQNLKRTRIQQETLAPLYHSGAAGGPGGPKCSPCETTKLICQSPPCVTDKTLCTFPTSVPEVKITVTNETTGKKSEEVEAHGDRVAEDSNQGCGEPEEVSEEEEGDSESRLLTGSCTCDVPVRQPLEVGENEDCSQAVSPGTLGNCSCGSEIRKDEKQKEDNVKTSPGRSKSFEKRDKMLLSKSETTATAPLVSFSSQITRSSISPPSTPLSELGPQLSEDQSGIKPPLTDSSLLKQEELDGITSAVSVSPKTTFASARDPLKPLGALSPDQGLGHSCGDSRGSKLSSTEAQLDCTPESLHSQLNEPNLTSAQVSGSNNTTFISSGQVMNFSGEVIVVYVGHSSPGSDGTDQGGVFRNPVQEEANESALHFQSIPRAQDSISHDALQDETLPVQEMMEREC
ncbi:tumor necrosis factor receptor superfamily member 11A isoform X2 [Takifugu rubripes]|uniref:Tumor necrosis factor receptor superfamily member 5 n=1 Tax=Takifugu rubripes TaxID=31033 RepID=A0A674MEZ9_TAKRU|nr:tumor necrosis factor receptor superfamily member 11A isoform X2 [Takifugu rubripes]